MDVHVEHSHSSRTARCDTPMPQNLGVPYVLTLPSRTLHNPYQESMTAILGAHKPLATNLRERHVTSTAHVVLQVLPRAAQRQARHDDAEVRTAAGAVRVGAKAAAAAATATAATTAVAATAPVTATASVAAATIAAAATTIATTATVTAAAAAEAATTTAEAAAAATVRDLNLLGKASGPDVSNTGSIALSASRTYMA